MKDRILILAFLPAALGIALVFWVFSAQEVQAQMPASELPPLHAGIDSPGAVIEEQPENPVFFFEGKVDWLLLEIAEPRTAWEYTQRGMFLQDDVEDVDAALEDYLHAKELLAEIAERLNDPTLPDRLLILHFRMANIYLKRGNYREAIQEFEVLLEEDPELSGVNRHIAEAYDGLREFENAYKAYQEELKLNPLNQKTLFEFALFLLEPEVRLEGVVQETVAREHLEIYLQEAAYHCDTYPYKILKADKLVRDLGGTGGSAALQNCF
jgi:tetratricopeptide (TPR) repeat protein